MEGSSKDLLHLEHKDSTSSSILGSKLLLVCKESQSQTEKPPVPPPDGKPITTPVPQSQVLGRVKDFLGVLSESNGQLEQDAKDNSRKYDIEALTGDESEVIEMDLMLGIADLHTPEAIAAAESAIDGRQPIIPLAASSSDTESEDVTDSDDNGSSEDDDDNDEKACSSKPKTCKFGDKAVGSKSSKRPKIVEIP